MPKIVVMHNTLRITDRGVHKRLHSYYVERRGQERWVEVGVVGFSKHRGAWAFCPHVATTFTIAELGDIRGFMQNTFTKEVPDGEASKTSDTQQQDNQGGG